MLVGALAACSGPNDNATQTRAVPSATIALAPTEPPPPTDTATVLATVAPSVTAAALATEVPTDTPTPEETNASPTIAAIDQDTFTSQVNELVDGAGGLTEVVVALADGTIIYDQNGAESMESASLYKLGIMVELYRQRDAGEITFDQGVYMYPGFFSEGEDVYTMDEIGSEVPIGDLLTNMITLSSNVAATALLYTAGTDNINNTLASLGLTSTEIRWSPGIDLPEDTATDSSDDGSSTDAPGDEEQPPTDETTAPDDTQPSGQAGGIVLTSAHGAPRLVRRPFADARADASLNVTTADDVASLYMQLLRGEVVDVDASQEMLDLLAQQEINDRLPVLLPTDTIVAHKTGNLDGLVHDAGVINAPAGLIIVAVLTEDVDEGVADDMIAQIALLAYELAS
jgi:beta-lactamase class A